MNQGQLTTLLNRNMKSIRRSWLLAVKAVDRDRDLATLQAERFASGVMKLAVQAGYREADFLRGLFNVDLAADRLAAERGGLVSRFLRDVRQGSPTHSVGLSSRQLRDLRAFASSLESAPFDLDLRDAVAANSRQVKRVQNAMLESRSKVIARTEATAAINLGTALAIEQTEEITGERIPRTWITAADERVRGSHSAMNGQTRFVGNPFITGNGVPMMYPGDINAPADERINCRCMITTPAA